MRNLVASLALLVAGCHSHHSSTMDAGIADLAPPPPSDLAPPPPDLSAQAPDDLAPPDDALAADDAAPPDLLAPLDLTPPVDIACNPLVFQGGVDPATQGWSTTAQPPETLSVPTAGVTQLTTSTNGGVSGQLLLSRALGVGSGHAFTLEFVIKVLSVSPHNPLDAAVALMGSFTAPAGTTSERSQMIYIDSDKIGWADDQSSAAVSSLDGAFHTYRLAVDAAGNATVFRDGTQLLTRTGYSSNGIVAFGDQTNDTNVDSSFQVQSVSLLCP